MSLVASFKESAQILSLACHVVSNLGAAAILVIPDSSLDWEQFRATIEKSSRKLDSEDRLEDSTSFRLPKWDPKDIARPTLTVPTRGNTAAALVLVACDNPRDAKQIREAGLLAVEVEPIEAAITERISLALIEAVANDHLAAGARVVVVYSGFEEQTLDSITIVRLGEHLERLTSRDLRALETSVPFETLKSVVDVGIEIGREGREGKAVGTLIVVGDVKEVLTRSHTLGFDPFHGYRRKDRNLRDPRVREAIKEIAQLDGAFLVARDGTVEAACRIIDAPNTGLTLPKGLGTRHWAAAAITKATNAIAIVVSQSTGAVRLFQAGEIVLRVAPMRHARAMKWTDAEIEHVGVRQDRE